VRGNWVGAGDVVCRAEGCIRFVDFCWMFGGPVDGTWCGVMGTVEGFWVGSAGVCCDGQNVVLW